MHNMSKVIRCTGMGHRSNIKAINKVLRNGNSLFYLDYWNKSYIIKHNNTIQ